MARGQAAVVDPETEDAYAQANDAYDTYAYTDTVSSAGSSDYTYVDDDLMEFDFQEEKKFVPPADGWYEAVISDITRNPTQGNTKENVKLRMEVYNDLGERVTTVTGTLWTTEKAIWRWQRLLRELGIAFGPGKPIRKSELEGKRVKVELKQRPYEAKVGEEIVMRTATDVNEIRGPSFNPPLPIAQQAAVNAETDDFPM
jgi:hypothetical protein